MALDERVSIAGERLLEPIIDHQGRIVRWTCTSCSWSCFAPPTLEPSVLDTVYAIFDEHNCQDCVKPAA
jgi:hypothetical protein